MFAYIVYNISEDGLHVHISRTILRDLYISIRCTLLNSPTVGGIFVLGNTERKVYPPYKQHHCVCGGIQCISSL